MEAEYAYFTEIGGSIRFIRGGENIDPTLIEIGCFMRIRLDLAERSLRILVPETIEGRSVSLVGIIPELPLGSPIPKFDDHPPIRYLYIPSGVRHLRIGTAITRNSVVPSDTAAEKFNPLNGCTVEISPDNPHFFVSGKGIYNNDMTELLYIFSPDECFEVPAGVKLIRSSAGCALKGMKRLTIPESVNVIEDCAFEGCPDLEYADIGAKNIGERAFFGCGSLKDVKLADTVRGIGDNAFALTEIRKLTIPPDVRMIGQSVLRNDPQNDTVNTILEVYIKNDALPIGRGVSPADDGTLLVVRSPETNKSLLELVILGSLDMIFTDHGIDFTEYDKKFIEYVRTDEDHARHTAMINMLAAAVSRLRHPIGMSAETMEFYKDYASHLAGLIIKMTILLFPDTAAPEIAEHPYLQLVDDKGILELIDLVANKGKTEITAVLMQELNERRNRNEEK